MIEENIETIEAGYEYLLAFAAQGRPAAAESGPGPHARPTIQGMADAMASLATHFADSNVRFEKVIANDCSNAGAALEFILAQEMIGSEIVDNLNASIHIRAVLTDLFLYSEALKPLDTSEPESMAYDASKS